MEVLKHSGAVATYPQGVVITAPQLMDHQTQIGGTTIDHHKGVHMMMFNRELIPAARKVGVLPQPIPRPAINLRSQLSQRVANLRRT